MKMDQSSYHQISSLISTENIVCLLFTVSQLSFFWWLLTVLLPSVLLHLSYLSISHNSGEAGIVLSDAEI